MIHVVDHFYYPRVW